MEDRIFFKDKSDTLRGPYTERQVQEWYRKGWFDNDFPFYFTQTDEPPTDMMESGILLGSLRSRNGNACPFVNFDEKETREFKEKKMKEKLEKIEKEIRDLRMKCTAILDLENRVESMESVLKQLADREVQMKTATPKENEKPKEEAVPVEKVKEPVPAATMQDFEELGEEVADLVLDAFQVYATGVFWDKERAEEIEWTLRLKTSEERRRAMYLACERILVEKMKEKEFFCCDLCQHVVFNYKQALVHFFSPDHIAKERDEVKKSGVVDIRRILDLFTKLPAKISEEDARIERERREKYGLIIPGNVRSLSSLRPSGSFGYNLCVKYTQLINADSVFTIDPLTGAPGRSFTESTILEGAQTAVEKTKATAGRKAFAELHKHLGKAQTYCVYCEFKTGDREGFYKHLVSSIHMQAVAKASSRYDLLTLLVNVHRKDLI